ncbi:hypothetical protein Enr17x_00080 [Gimesia fumaroli]|uniref:Uncharacterized protein n=1 Tax=Gimesia fumaroli TaxID=2527976 RepID=A0A518I4G4_9PLAN|nr:hypothetical protein Enr17x_00080 [Gimesia fumaroli]
MDCLSGSLCALISDCRVLCYFITLIVNRGMDVSSGICFKRCGTGVDLCPWCVESVSICGLLCSKCVDPHKKEVLIMNQTCDVEKKLV